jgi:hypothetical protein
MENRWSVKRINEKGREVALCLPMRVHEPGLSLRQVHDNDLNNLAKAISGRGDSRIDAVRNTPVLAGEAGTDPAQNKNS